MEYAQPTKGERAISLSHRELTEEEVKTINTFKFIVGHLIDDSDFHKTDNNARELSIAQTHFETGIMYLTKALINK